MKKSQITFYMIIAITFLLVILFIFLLNNYIMKNAVYQANIVDSSNKEGLDKAADKEEPISNNSFSSEQDIIEDTGYFGLDNQDIFVFYF